MTSLPKPQYLSVELPGKSEWMQLTQDQLTTTRIQFDYVEQNLHKAAPSKEILTQYYIQSVASHDASQNIHHMDFGKDIQHFIDASQVNLTNSQDDFTYQELIRGLATVYCVKNPQEIDDLLDNLIEEKDIYTSRSPSTF